MLWTPLINNELVYTELCWVHSWLRGILLFHLLSRAPFIVHTWKGSAIVQIPVNVNEVPASKFEVRRHYVLTSQFPNSKVSF